MSLLAAWLLAAGLACSEAEPRAPAEAPLVLRGVELDRGDGLVVRAAKATVDATGQGRAEQVQATLAPSPPQDQGAGREPPPLQVEAPRSAWDLKARTVQFEGGVRATRGPVELTCDTLEVRYLDAERVDQAVAEGHVVVVRDGRRATGDRAVLTTADGRLVLTGSPTVTEGANTLRGRQITLFLDDERLECESCTLVVAGSATAPR